METKTKYKVFLVEDHAVFRQGLTWVIEQDKEFQVCGEAVDGHEALKKLKEKKPDLVIIDIGLAGMSGIELTKNIRTSMPDVKILILSMHKEELYAERALRAGANGYIMKKESGEELVSAMKQVLSGKIYASAQFGALLLQKVVGSGHKVTEFSIDLLSNRELEVFERIGRGLSTRQIADELGISMKTVESHREHIRAKLNLATNAELVQHSIHWVHSEKNLD